MPTNRTKRIRKIVQQNLSDPWRYFLSTGDYLSAISKEKFPDVSLHDKFHIFQFGHPSPGGGYWEKLRKIWMQHRTEILSDWKKQKKKGLPWAAKLFKEKGE